MEKSEKYLDFVLPTKLKFGPGMSKEIPEDIPPGCDRVGMITTEDLLRIGAPGEIAAKLKERGVGVEIFADVKSNPHLNTIKTGYEFFRDFRPTYMIGLGGGSVIDTTKGIAICLANKEEDITALEGGSDSLQHSVPFFAVPTTSGTGSEVDYWAVISDPKTKEKLSIGYPEMSPQAAVVDPELTLTLPPKLTLFTGIDAFTHALEAYFSAESNKLSDTLALKSMKLIFGSLTTAIESGQDLQARGDMALASTLAGVAMQHVGLGLIHAMSHQVSGFYDTNHGLANALLTPNVLEFNRESAPEKYDDLSTELGGDTVRRLKELFSRHSVNDYQVTIYEEDLDDLTSRASVNVNAETNPRDATNEEITNLYRQSFTVGRKN